MTRMAVIVYFESQDDTPLVHALLCLRELTFDVPTSEVAEHYGQLVIKALERASQR